MGSWRPKDWKAPTSQDLPDWTTEEIYEAGAEDMLEALIKRQQEVKKKDESSSNMPSV